MRKLVSSILTIVILTLSLTGCANTMLLTEAKKAAQAKVKEYFVLRKIANQEKITVSQQEVEFELRQLGAYMGYKEKDIRKMLENNSGFSEIYSDILMRKTVAFIADQAKV